jgi:hypothetical protein
MAQRSKYWSNSKVADFIRGDKKPGSATAEGWNKWEKASKEKSPIRYWIVETAFDAVQNFLWWPIDKLYDFKYYCNNRFVTKTHSLTSSTLRKGAWAEFGTRVLHCNFDELVNFVEVESAWSHIAWGEPAERAKYKTPWYAYGWFRLRTWRCKAAGLDHLYWASSLVFDNDMGVSKGDALYGKPTQQAETAKETLALYHWWKNVRPKREDPHDAGGWTAICEATRAKDPDNIMAMLDHSNETPEERDASTAALHKTRDIEAAYEAEDEEMLIRLVKLAPKLWT